jgi:anti-sigma-K factor RskA
MSPIRPTSPPPEDDLQALAGEYVLGTLDAEKRAALERQMQTDVLLSDAVAQWNARLLPLSQLAEPIAPPARLWTKIEASLGLQPTVSMWQRFWGNLALWRAVASASVVASVWMATLLLHLPPDTAPKFLVVLVAPQDKAPGWVIQATDARAVNLIPLGVFEVPKDKSLQFWTKADDWKGPVSLGLIKPGQQVKVPLDALPDLKANQLFELTLEPANGSPLDRPTGPVQFIGRAVPIT